MGKAYICDRCGEFYTTEQDPSNNDFYVSCSKVEHHVHGKNSYSLNAMDLCPYCRVKIYNFLRNITKEL